jgi:hypothetical protein
MWRIWLRFARQQLCKHDTRTQQWSTLCFPRVWQLVQERWRHTSTVGGRHMTCVSQLADVRWRHTATVCRNHVICVYCWSMTVPWLYKWAEFLSWQRNRNSSGGSTRENELELKVTVAVSSEFPVGDNHRKFVFEEELTCESKTLCVL